MWAFIPTPIDSDYILIVICYWSYIGIILLYTSSYGIPIGIQYNASNKHKYYYAFVKIVETSVDILPAGSLRFTLYTS